MLGPRRSHPALADLLRKKARMMATRKHEQETIQEAFASRLAAIGRERGSTKSDTAPARRNRPKPS